MNLFSLFFFHYIYIVSPTSTFRLSYRHESDDDFTSISPKTEPALIYDAVFVFAIGLQTLEQSHTLRLSNISCADEHAWDDGLSVINYINTVCILSNVISCSASCYHFSASLFVSFCAFPVFAHLRPIMEMRGRPTIGHNYFCLNVLFAFLFVLAFSAIYRASFQVELKGLSGPIEFKEGRRIQFKLDLVKLKQQSLVKAGEWTPHNGLNITDRSIFFDAGRINVTLLVVTILVSRCTVI